MKLPHGMLNLTLSFTYILYICTTFVLTVEPVKGELYGWKDPSLNFHRLYSFLTSIVRNHASFSQGTLSAFRVEVLELSGNLDDRGIPAEVKVGLKFCLHLMLYADP